METTYAFSGDRICLSSTHCAFTEAAVFSKSLLGDTPTTTEIWYLIPSAKKYILLNFETFDIGCQTGNILEIETTTTGKRAICNKNKAEMLSGLKADGLSMKITFKFERRVSYLIEGFGARYVQLECKNFESELVSEEASGTT